MTNPAVMAAIRPAGILQPARIDIVSVQSQVVYGAVGNSVALPALQSLGLQAAAVPTVLLSNTPHYPSMHGGVVPLDWFSGYLADLEARGALAQLRVILIGYLGSGEQARVLADWIEHMQAVRPGLRIHLDPVFGDHEEGVYVDPALVEVTRRCLLPLAHGLTPNHFELELLAGRPLSSLTEVTDFAAELLTGQTEWVVVTSAAPAFWPVGQMHVAVVTRTGAQVWAHKWVPATPKGTGDLFSAMLTGYLLQGVPLVEAARQACEHVVAVLERTCERGWEELALFGV